MSLFFVKKLDFSFGKVSKVVLKMTAFVYFGKSNSKLEARSSRLLAEG
jgi:hypothetical protein